MGETIDVSAMEELDMAAPLNGLLRAGLALKLNQIKLATRSYLRDRTNQAMDTVTSYAVAAALFAAAGIFLIAACLIALTALFRWIEIKYGLFQAFGAVGALLLMIAAICAGIAVRKLKHPPPHFPSLISRLRVAITTNPVKPDQIEAARDTAAAILLAPPASVRANRGTRELRQGRNSRNRNMGAGLILVATLLGWAAVRRRQQARGTAA
jgi:Putative Actinobacterial Holin-X, holin superfamily III